MERLSEQDRKDLELAAAGVYEDGRESYALDHDALFAPVERILDRHVREAVAAALDEAADAYQPPRLGDESVDQDEEVRHWLRIRASAVRGEWPIGARS